MNFDPKTIIYDKEGEAYMKGLVHIYEGDGKGKTTAAIGLCIRCVGYGEKVLFTQFMKDNRSSELEILRKIEGISFIPCDKAYGFSWTMSEETKIEAKEVYTKHLKNVINLCIKDSYRMLVVDEIISAYNLEFIDRSILIEFLRNKPEQLEVVMTGRNPAIELVELADYVSEIKKIKHPYDHGVPSRKGIES